MSGLYGFRCSTPGAPLAASTLVIFCGPNAFTETDVQAVIQRATRTGAAPELVLLLVPDDQAMAVLALYPNSAAWDPISGRGTETKVIAYDHLGALEFRPQGKLPEPVPLGLADAIRRQGMTCMFRDRGGMLEAGPSAYFVKPSTSPDSRFLRAAQALSEGPEIFFAALWLLPWLTPDVGVIHVDTSSISHLVFAALLMRGPSTSGELPGIRTFRSYEGVHQHPFSRDRRELCLVSASQSGSMATLLAQKVQNRSDVVTLFSMADTVEGTAVLCDLRWNESLNTSGYLPSVDRTPRHASRPVRLIGEHFIAEARPASAVVPLKTDAPKCVGHLAKLKGGEAFSMLQSHPPDDGKAPWINVEKLLQTSTVRNWLSKEACAAIPVTTKALVLADNHPATKNLADELSKEVVRQTGRAAEWKILTLKEIEAGKAPWLEKTPMAPVVVIAGATGHGRELLSVSRALRDYAPNSLRIFLTTIVSGANVDAIGMLERNLKFGGHQFIRMFDLPIDRRRSAGSWRREVTFLEEFEGELPSDLEGRLTDLRKTSVGLTNNLFLSVGEDPLELRQNFAFWPAGDARGANQADVFVTIASLLEHLRSGADPVPAQRMLNDAHTQTVLAPEVFSRFNDGVIQSALLRAALPVELNYASSRDQSRAMVDLILQMTDLHDRQQGEALPEFLMALRSGRLFLEADQKARLESGLAPKADGLPALTSWLIKNSSRGSVMAEALEA